MEGKHPQMELLFTVHLSIVSCQSCFCSIPSMCLNDICIHLLAWMAALLVHHCIGHCLMERFDAWLHDVSCKTKRQNSFRSQKWSRIQFKNLLSSSRLRVKAWPFKCLKPGSAESLDPECQYLHMCITHRVVQTNACIIMYVWQCVCVSAWVGGWQRKRERKRRERERCHVYVCGHLCVCVGVCVYGHVTWSVHSHFNLGSSRFTS